MRMTNIFILQNLFKFNRKFSICKVVNSINKVLIKWKIYLLDKVKKHEKCQWQSKK